MARPGILPPGVDAAMAKLKKQRERVAMHGAEDTDEAEDVVGDARIMSRTPVHVLQVVPCVPVLHLEIALTFYTKVLGFVRRGAKHDTKCARVYRGTQKPTSVRGVYKPTSELAGVHLDLRVLPTPHPTQLVVYVNNVDAMFLEAAEKLYLCSMVMNGYFPLENFGAARIASRPQNTLRGTREFTVVDPDENVLVFVSGV
ncbi:hypothetical protein MVES1_003218 [Malassezia vespertilionis]|uniref:uncharacterized protein n=1 Tax=Malassezia vespertilionis TaxID=2020962 RepID=UPI0024B2508C|nr:uncharacterized protein MVES1_003218 [Malassezia vespertilionis]WFD07851.1 hypothetical protein MVES1_003218 [Malassezia vespertilionis]